MAAQRSHTSKQTKAREQILPEMLTGTIHKPQTFRLPKQGTLDPHFGCTRTFWNQRVLPSEENRQKPPVESIVVKTAGTKRGIRLILYSSAEAYFRRLLKAQTQSAAANA